MPTAKNRPPIHIRVVRHSPQGLYVNLKNGETGIIRAREISWADQDPAQWRETHPIGWEGYALPVPDKKGDIPELSLRLMEYDPWDDFFEGLDRESVFVGMVTGTYTYGAFIEIEDGIIGLLRKSQLPQKIQASVPDVFWHGDKVAIRILEVDHEQRHIEFTLAPPQNLADGQLPVERHSFAGSFDEEHELESLLNSTFPNNRILVVEDEPAQSTAVCGWLRDFGQSVEAFPSAEDALQFLSTSEIDIALVDAGLPGMSGTELAHEIYEKHPQTQVVIMTDWARANELQEAMTNTQQQGFQFLYKPFLPEDLANYLLYNQDHGSRTNGTNGKHAIKRPSIGDSRKDIHTLLARCRKKLGMEQVFLFALDTGHRHISIPDHVGEGSANRNAIGRLIYSPVRDVAEDGEHFFIEELGEKEQKRFHYLLEFAPMITACIGAPVPTNSTLKYALFVVDRHAREFSSEIKTYMEGMSLAIGATLDKISLKEQAALIQRSALMGNLTSGMIHEINNLVTPLQYDANHLRRSLARADKDPDHDREAIKAEISSIEREIRQIINTVKIFGKIAKKPQSEILKVAEIIEDTIVLLTHLSKQTKTKVYFPPPEQIIIVRNQAALLEQILLNISLNAIQQISEYQPASGGAIRFDIELIDEVKEEAVCRILIHDNGPGIHASLWEKIFEMGYSTRQDGSGIGLYISRSLMDEIGGKIYVADSRILSGTTFALEFPVDF